MKYGCFVALGSVGLFIVIVIVIVIVSVVLDVEGDAGAIVGALASLALAAGLWAGTALVAVEKGYHVVLGIILGMFAPLGLLVVALLPDRSHAASRH